MRSGRGWPDVAGGKRQEKGLQVAESKTTLVDDSQHVIYARLTTSSWQKYLIYVGLTTQKLTSLESWLTWLKSVSTWLGSLYSRAEFKFYLNQLVYSDYCTQVTDSRIMTKATEADLNMVMKIEIKSRFGKTTMA